MPPGQPQPVSGYSVRALVDLLVHLERRCAAGPWDDWDGVALDQCVAVVRRRLDDAYSAMGAYNAHHEQMDAHDVD